MPDKIEYEITARVANGDDHWFRATYVDFHAACQSGIAYAEGKQARLVRVEIVPAK